MSDYNETEFRNSEFDYSNNIDISNSEQMTNTVKIQFTGNTYLSSSPKETFTSTFKTASEIIKEERLRLSTLDKDRKAQSLELSANNNAQRSTSKNDKLQMSGFVCARKIHEGDMINSNTSSSKSKVHRNKTDKTAKRAAKTVYEQILAQSSSKKTVEERKDVPFKAELKVDNVNSIKTKNEVKSESKNKRGYEYVECHENDIKFAKKKRIVHDDYVDKTSDNISDKNNDKKILNDKIMKMIRKSTDTVINTINDNLSRTTQDNTEKHFEIKTNAELKRKEETTHLSRSKSHKNSSSNRPKVPADKATQFKTAEILKSYLMKYYPSERLPDRATFTKTCREMHYNMLHKKIFGTISLKVYNIIL